MSKNDLQAGRVGAPRVWERLEWRYEIGILVVDWRRFSVKQQLDRLLLTSRGSEVQQAEPWRVAQVGVTAGSIEKSYQSLDAAPCDNS